MVFRAIEGEVKLMVVDPGHFHAALLQKSMYPGVEEEVHVYGPEGAELQAYLKAIASYNSREEAPTSWKLKLHIGPDFLSQMIADKPGNVVLIAGNNLRKTAFIKAAAAAGIYVLADKPMAIEVEGFKQLKEAFAETRGVLAGRRTGL